MAKSDTELVSMKVPAREKADVEKMYNAKPPEYPYGLRIRLENEQLKALGIDKLPAIGKGISIVAEAEVCSTSQYESDQGGTSKTLELQITALNLS